MSNCLSSTWKESPLEAKAQPHSGSVTGHVKHYQHHRVGALSHQHEMWCWVGPQRLQEKPSNHKTGWWCREKLTSLTESLRTKILKHRKKAKDGHANKSRNCQKDSTTDNSKTIGWSKNDFEIDVEALQVPPTHKKRKIKDKSKTGGEKTISKLWGWEIQSMK